MVDGWFNGWELRDVLAVDAVRFVREALRVRREDACEVVREVARDGMRDESPRWVVRVRLSLGLATYCACSCSSLTIWGPMAVTSPAPIVMMRSL